MKPLTFEVSYPLLLSRNESNKRFKILKDKEPIIKYIHFNRSIVDSSIKAVPCNNETETCLICEKVIDLVNSKKHSEARELMKRKEVYIFVETQDKEVAILHLPNPVYEGYITFISDPDTKIKQSTLEKHDIFFTPRRTGEGLSKSYNTSSFEIGKKEFSVEQLRKISHI